jgi:hypothetical protein
MGRVERIDLWRMKIKRRMKNKFKTKIEKKKIGNKKM